MSISTDLFVASVFAQLQPQTLKQLADFATTRYFADKEVFYKQGDDSLGLFLIKTGQVKLYRQSQDKSQILALLSTGDIFGVDSSYNQSPCPTFAEALSNGWSIFLPCDAIENLVHAYPDFSLLLLHIISEELKLFTSLVHRLAFKDVSTRLAEVLLNQMTIQHKLPENNQVVLDRTLSQQDLAALVGTAREVIYRTLKKFEQDELLQLSSATIHIMDVKRLSDLAQQEVE